MPQRCRRSVGRLWWLRVGDYQDPRMLWGIRPEPKEESSIKIAKDFPVVERKQSPYPIQPLKPTPALKVVKSHQWIQVTCTQQDEWRIVEKKNGKPPVRFK